MRLIDKKTKVAIQKISVSCLKLSLLEEFDQTIGWKNLESRGGVMLKSDSGRWIFPSLCVFLGVLQPLEQLRI